MATKVAFLLCIFTLAATSLSQKFQLLVLGGYPAKYSKDVTLYNISTNKSGCALESLPTSLNDGPLAGLMNDKIVVCGKGPSCYAFHPQTQNWTSGLSFDLEEATMVTTFDYKAWSVWRSRKIKFWREGMDSFSLQDVGSDLRPHMCSTRMNQTHAITSHGTSRVYWYQESGNQFQQWDRHGKGPSHITCGLQFNSDIGFQFVIAGGWNSGHHVRNSEVFDFKNQTWTSGPPLPTAMSASGHVQFQNTFLVIGGNREGNDKVDTVLLFDGESGWVELPTKLNNDLSYMGVMHVPPGMLKC